MIRSNFCAGSMVLFSHCLFVELSIDRLFCMMVVWRAERFGGDLGRVTDEKGRVILRSNHEYVRICIGYSLGYRFHVLSTLNWTHRTTVVSCCENQASSLSKHNTLPTFFTRHGYIMGIKLVLNENSKLKVPTPTHTLLSLFTNIHQSQQQSNQLSSAAQQMHFSPVNKTVCPLKCVALMSLLSILVHYTVNMILERSCTCNIKGKYYCTDRKNFWYCQTVSENKFSQYFTLPGSIKIVLKHSNETREIVFLGL
jgi:hypothetical protein